mgnify:CR=1 FL=1
MERTELNAKIKEICAISNRLHGFEENEESFLEAIKGLDRKYLTVERDKFSEGSLNWQGVLKPVNFLKFLVIDSILNGKAVSLKLIDELKVKILARDADYFRDYPDFKEAMLKLEEGKNFFHQWNNIFKILFYVYYDQYKDGIITSMTEISEHMKTVLNMKDCKTTVNGFGWNNNYGSSDCWIALYPSDRDTHRRAYQIFLRINPVNKVVYGMGSGDEMEEKNKLDTQDGQNINSERMEKFLFEEAKPKYEELNASIKYEPKEGKEAEHTIVSVDEKHPKNMILYGSPGTGKTYDASEEAVKIVDPSFAWKTRSELMKRYRELQENGFITFVTFHQSYSYEEFVEGYRYDEETKIPKVEPGLFKTLVESARTDYLSPKKKIDLNLAKRKIFKMSLGNTLRGEEDIYEYCIKNNVIGLGWGQTIDYSTAKDKEGIRNLFEKQTKSTEDSAFNVTAVNHFKNLIHNEDLVFVSKGNRALRAIGKVVGDYFYDTNAPIEYRHFRKVEWLLVDISIPVEKVMRKNFSQQTIYEIDKGDLIEANLAEILSKPSGEKKEVKNYVLLIDEINRGNISKIFGELITLIEDDKRLGMDNEITVKLPYSKETSFGIPPNIFILGTMNTADRSIALMDVALRRRFSFRKVVPDSKVIRDLLIDKEVNEEFIEILEKTFNVLNKRIKVLLDEDHMIGHSYFLNIGKEDSEYNLHAVWYDKIVPLIQEYFYNDWDKIKLVLGEYDPANKRGFVRNLESDYKGIFDNEYDDEYPCEFFKHSPDNFSLVLKNTFVGTKNE